MNFLKAELKAGCTEALRRKDGLEKLSHGAHAEIISLFMGAKIVPDGPGTCLVEFSCPGANCTNHPVFMAYTPTVPSQPQVPQIQCPRCRSYTLVKK